MSRARAGIRDKWVPKVLHSDVNDGCKLLLVTMARLMADDGTVEILREELAALLGVHPRRITERINAAVKARLLDRQGGGYNHHPTRYIAVIPSPVNGAANPHHSAQRERSEWCGNPHPRSAPFSTDQETMNGAANPHPMTPALKTEPASESEHTTRQARFVAAHFDKSKGASSVSSGADRFAARRCVCGGMRTVEANCLRAAS